MSDYIKWLREKVGRDLIFLNFAGGWIENSKGEVLLQKRSAAEEIWGFPGGAMELGESAAETALREIREETGLTVKVDSLIGVYTNYFDSYPNGDKAQTILFFFRCSVIGGNLLVDQKETFDLAFFDPKNMPELFNRQHQDMLVDALSQRQGIFR